MKRRATTDDAATTIVKLNVGGRTMETTLNTLAHSYMHFPDSTLAALFAGDAWLAQLDAQGCYFVDAHPDLFAAVLNVLRRPITLQCVPHGVDEAVWRAELDYWGLAASTRDVSPAQVVCEDEMAVLGAQIRRQVIATEETVVRALLERTGYLATTGKTRFATLYVPVKEARLPWGQELYEYLRLNNQATVRALKRFLGADVPVAIDNYTSRVAHQYTFDDVAYSTAECKTIQVTFDLSLCDTK